MSSSPEPPCPPPPGPLSIIFVDSSAAALQVRFYTACVLRGLEYMHQRGVIHRDIKPSNFLLDARGYVKICDYGLSKFLRQGDRTRTWLGTLAYIPPEQVAAHRPPPPPSAQVLSTLLVAALFRRRLFVSRLSSLSPPPSLAPSPQRL